MSDIVYSVRYELVVKEDNESVLSVKDSLISHIVLLVDIRVFLDS